MRGSVSRRWVGRWATRLECVCFPPAAGDAHYTKRDGQSHKVGLEKEESLPDSRVFLIAKEKNRSTSLAAHTCAPFPDCLLPRTSRCARWRRRRSRGYEKRTDGNVVEEQRRRLVEGKKVFVDKTGKPVTLMCSGLASWLRIRGSESVELTSIEPKPHCAELVSYLGFPDTPRAFVLTYFAASGLCLSGATTAAVSNVSSGTSAISSLPSSTRRNTSPSAVVFAVAV